MERDIIKEVRTELGLADIEKRDSLKKNLLKAGMVAGAVVALSSGVNATSIFYRDESGNETDLKGNPIHRTLAYTIGNGTDLVSLTSEDYFCVPENITIKSAKIENTQLTNATIQLDVKTSSTLTGARTSITASAKPTLSGQTSVTNSTLTGWTTSITAGTYVWATMVSNTDCKKVRLSLECDY